MKRYIKLLIVLYTIFSVLLINFFPFFCSQLNRFKFVRVNATMENSPNSYYANLLVNGRKVDIKEKLIITEGVIWMPIRSVFDTLGAKVVWDDYYRSVTVNYKGISMQFFPQNKFAIVNGKRKNIKEQVKITESRMYVSLKFIADTYGAVLETDEKAATVNLKNFGIITNNELGINIKGDEAFVERTLKALNLLGAKSKENFDVVQKYVGLISQGDMSGMAAYENPPTFYVGNPTSDASTIWYASAIAHDSYHSKLYHDYKDIHGTVPDNVWGGYDAEMKCLEYQIGVLERVGASIEEVNYARSLRGTNWWDKPVTW